MGQRQTKPVPYDIKVIESGNVKEVYHYGETRFRGYERSQSYGASCNSLIITEVDKETGEIKTREATTEETEAIKEARKMESRATSNQRARNNLRRLVLANFSNSSKFITLTFRDNVTDIELANKTFKRFIKYVNEDLTKHYGKSSKLAYVAVIEFQKRGSIHYHMICKGLPPYYRFEKVINRWSQAIRSVVGSEGEFVGSVKIHKISHVDNVGAYVVKYMTKSDADKRLFGKKIYQTSRGLKKPTEKTYRVKSEEEYQNLMEELGIDHKKIVFRSQYQDKFTLANVEYLEINTERRTQKSCATTQNVI